MTNYQDEIIRSFSAFKGYNHFQSRILSETPKWRKPKGFEESIFCGKFIAEIWKGQKVFGKYEFDCSEFDCSDVPNKARYRIKKIA